MCPIFGRGSEGAEGLGDLVREKPIRRGARPEWPVRRFRVGRVGYRLVI